MTDDTLFSFNLRAARNALSICEWQPHPILRKLGDCRRLA
jgi:hypothetical protein